MSLDNYHTINDGTINKETGQLDIVIPTVYTLALSLMVSSGLTVIMADRYAATEKFMPAGMIAVLSGGMSLFYVYKLVTKREHTPHQKKE